MNQKRIFMTCEWRDLIMSTFEVEKSVLEPYLPKDTAIDLYNGKALISLVAFTFSKVKFFGIKVPFHQHFGQINFRFYAKSKTDGSRGVVFIKEFAPKHLIALVGNTLYNEPYFFKDIGLKKQIKEDSLKLSYNFRDAAIKAEASYSTKDLKKNTLKHFVVDRYIAFIKNKKNKTVRYNIYHKPWKTYQLSKSVLDNRLLQLLPTNFKNLKHLSTYLINGSQVSIQRGVPQ
ncbi:DUF2071 domain-containing protein [Seonamhaeicola maritimus]|uniref:DUF2071 domain-containing protein n=1 Tax=Seonamhaeicola maritimus TaxID=2591822 RepID=A0A5C7GE48_9FLAO|nr:DUF2071 domain-containing protein [Seonamhaeicola maritimus]TXG34570.1 DUF2071 domain-containing protein [Seonamhaeicola maritimus]